MDIHYSEVLPQAFPNFFWQNLVVKVKLFYQPDYIWYPPYDIMSDSTNKIGTYPSKFFFKTNPHLLHYPSITIENNREENFFWFFSCSMVNCNRSYMLLKVLRVDDIKLDGAAMIMSSISEIKTDIDT